MTNLLALETSPYLLQHQNNPVEWHPWNDTALKRAAQENKPILLSIGYSACHWCHVMAHESFEDPQIAALMNANFINIKVDREERPDLDQIYQNVAQMMTHSGGWPLTVFLTPKLEPFFGGTYFPPRDQHGRPGFPRVLAALAQMFREQPEAIAKNAGQIMENLSRLEAFPKSADGTEKIKVQGTDFVSVVEELVKRVDFSDGGLGDAPKFPNTMNLAFLWRAAEGLKELPAELRQKAKKAVIFSMECMVTRGLFDQLGGGFHRYCVDDTWTVPHFEKMLYDNALLLELLAEILLTPESPLTKAQRALFLDAGRLTVGFLKREMFDEQAQAFYAALDADSEGVEGRFYVWNLENLKSAFDQSESALVDKAASHFGIQAGGNFFEPHGHADQGMTVLHRASWKPHDGETLTPFEVKKIRDKMLESRKTRTRPGTDTKILCSWNALMLSGLFWWSAVEKTEAATLVNAQNSAQAVESLDADELWRWASNCLAHLPALFTGENAEMLSVHCQGRSKFTANLDDLAFWARACLDQARFGALFGENALQKPWLLAQKLCQDLLRRFHDNEAGGFFFTPSDHPDGASLIQRPKSLFDQAIPAGSSVGFMNLLVLDELSAQFDLPAQDDEKTSVKINLELDQLTSFCLQNPFGVGQLLLTLLARHLEFTKVEAPSLHELGALLQGSRLKSIPLAHVWWKISPEIKSAQACAGQKCIIL